MDGLLRVELADLRGWAAQVGRAGDDCAYLADYLTRFVPDGDFGPILWPIRADYERLTGRVREVLALEADRLDDTGAALRHAAASYARTDARVARDLGVGAAITDDGRVGRGFHDTGPSTPPAPEFGGESLPVVTFGGVLDQANELVIRSGGPDIRSWVTDLIAGDIGKAAAQASAWEHAGRALAAVRDNLAHGSHAVARTWDGAAATSSRSCTDAWVGALERHSDTLAGVAAHLRDAIEQAVDVAQLVTDVVKEIMAIVFAGWGYACIPIVGQAQLVERLSDVLRLVWDAKKVLTVFWYFLLVIKDCFVTAVDCLSAESLPPAPTVPARAA